MKQKSYYDRLFSDLTVQDAIMIIAIYASQVNPEDSKETIKHLSAIAKSYRIFAETGDTVKRINYYVNAFGGVVPPEALEKAALPLNPEQRKTAFEVAVRAAMPDQVLSDDRKKNFDTIIIKLQLDDQSAQEIIEKYKKRQVFKADTD